MGGINKERVAECIGLWLAEGSTTSKTEITFTNNCLELVNFFKNITDKLFKKFIYNKRIYVYTSDGSKPELSFKDCQINYYIHRRATRPYFIFRIASVKIMKEWRKLINQLLNNERFYVCVLRGFFAGEGNIHEGKRGVRLIRISQKERKYFIDKMLEYLNIRYNFTFSNRNYNISNKKNWDIFAKYALADLHPIKKEKFWRLYHGFKEEHYDKFYLRNQLLNLIKEPFTSKRLANLLNRSQARVTEVLTDLKKESQAKNFRVKSITYWINNKNIIIISAKKAEYLLFLNKDRKTYEFAKHFNVTWKSSFRRLYELNKLNLVRMEENGLWKKMPTEKKIVVI